MKKKSAGRLRRGIRAPEGGTAVSRHNISPLLPPPSFHTPPPFFLLLLRLLLLLVRGMSFPQADESGKERKKERKNQKQKREERR